MDTLLLTQKFPRLPARATFVADTKDVSGTKMFPSLRSPRNIMGNNVSATTCPRVPGPLLSLKPHVIISLDYWHREYNFDVALKTKMSSGKKYFKLV